MDKDTLKRLREYQTYLKDQIASSQSMGNRYKDHKNFKAAEECNTRSRILDVVSDEFERIFPELRE